MKISPILSKSQQEIHMDTTVDSRVVLSTRKYEYAGNSLHIPVIKPNLKTSF